LGRKFYQPAKPYFNKVVACAQNIKEEIEIRVACIVAIGEITSNEAAPGKESSQILLELLAEEEGQVLDATARSLTAIEKTHFGNSNAAPVISDRLYRETDVMVQISLLKALGIIGGKDRAMLEQTLAVSTELLGDNDQAVRSNVLSALGQIGEYHPELIPDILNTIESAYTDPDTDVRLRATLALRDMGFTSPENAINCIHASEKLLTYPDSSTRQDTLLNIIDPLVLKYPMIAEDALDVVNLVYESPGVFQTDEYRRLTSTAWRAKENIYIILAENDPQRIWKWLASASEGERSLGREAMLSLLVNHPDLQTEIENKLLTMQDDHRAYVRDSSSKSLETLTLLAVKQEYLEGDNYSCSWVAALEWLNYSGEDLFPVGVEFMHGSASTFSSMSERCLE